MLKKSLCLVLGFMCIGDACGSSKELPLGSFKSSGENDLNLEEDIKDVAPKEKNILDVSESPIQQKSVGNSSNSNNGSDASDNSSSVNTSTDSKESSDENQELLKEVASINLLDANNNSSLKDDGKSLNIENPPRHKDDIYENSIKKILNNIIDKIINSLLEENEKSFTDKPVKKNGESSHTNEKDLTMESLVDEEISYEESNSETTDYSEDETYEHQIEQMMGASQVSVCCIPMIKDKEKQNKLINEINTTLQQYQKYIKDEKKSFNESYEFLFTLMCMCAYSNVLDPSIDVKLILKDLGIKESEIGKDIFVQGKLIHSWFVNNEDDTIHDFLGETRYPNRPTILDK